MPKSFVYRTAEYRCEGRARYSDRPYYTYRWVDPTFALEDRIGELERDYEAALQVIKDLKAKINPFDDGLGGW